jgi:hypothetical protein
VRQVAGDQQHIEPRELAEYRLAPPGRPFSIKLISFIWRRTKRCPELGFDEKERASIINDHIGFASLSQFILQPRPELPSKVRPHAEDVGGWQT